MKHRAVAAVIGAGVGFGCALSIVLLVLPFVPQEVGGEVAFPGDCTFTCYDFPAPPTYTFPSGTPVTLQWNDSNGGWIFLVLYYSSSSNTSLGVPAVESQGIAGTSAFVAHQGEYTLVVSAAQPIPEGGTSVNYSFDFDAPFATW